MFAWEWSQQWRFWMARLGESCGTLQFPPGKALQSQTDYLVTLQYLHAQVSPVPAETLANPPAPETSKEFLLRHYQNL